MVPWYRVAQSVHHLVGFSLHRLATAGAMEGTGSGDLVFDFSSFPDAESDPELGNGALSGNNVGRDIAKTPSEIARQSENRTKTKASAPCAT